MDIWQNFGYGLRVKRKEIYLYIRKCVTTLQIILTNEIPGNNGLFKVQVPKIKYDYQIKVEF